LHQYALDAGRIGYEGLFARQEAADRQHYSSAFHPDFLHPGRTESFRSLSRIIRIAHSHGVRLVIFIPPYHVRYLQIIRDAGLWPEFESWKRALVRVTARADMGGQPAVELVDFSGASAFTAEPVPPKGDTSAMMRWYWDPGHYKPALGDEVLRRLITGRGRFGERLTPDTIETALVRENPQPQMK
jgi:hypothetical protein